MSIEIRSGKMAALLAPELGGTVLSLTHDGRHILRPTASEQAVAADPREAACYPCVPWFGRLADGLVFGGVRYALSPTLPACDPEHALHGHGWVSSWRITDRRDDVLVCRFDYAPAPGGFPFPFSALQEFSASADAFTIELSVTNTGKTAMPAGLGLHPFFPRMRTTRITINGPASWMAPRTGAPPQPFAFDLPDGRLPAETADFSAAGWAGEATIVQDGAKLRLHSDAPILHLYAPAGEAFFCAEPITHLPGAFGADILEPGASKKIKMQFAL